MISGIESVTIQIPSMQFVFESPWSAYSAQVQVTNVATDKALANIVIPALPTGAVITSVYAIVKIRVIENTNSTVNALSGAQNFQVQNSVGGAYTTSIAFAGGELSVPSLTRESGDVLGGTANISSQVSASGCTLNAKFTAALAALPNLNLNDVQWKVRIMYHL